MPPDNSGSLIARAISHASLLLLLALCVSAVLLVSPQKAQAAATISFLQSATDPDPGDLDHNFTNQSLGTEAADRIIFVVVSAEDAGGDVATVTVAGNSMTKVASAFDSGGGDLGAIYWAHVPTGTSATIVVLIEDFGNVGIGVFRATGLGTSLTAFDTASDLDDTISMSIDVPEGGALIAGAAFNAGGTAVTTVGVTEAYDIQNTASGDRAVGGADGPVFAETNRTVSFDGGTGNAAGAAVSFEAAAGEEEQTPRRIIRLRGTIHLRGTVIFR